MSLRSLLKNYFTIVSVESAPVDSEGAIERDFNWSILPDYINQRCAIQGITKKDVVEIYGKQEGVPLFKVYHQLRTFSFSPAFAILTAKNPLDKITNFEDRMSIRFFHYVGQRDPVLHKSRGVPLEFIVEENFRWEF